MPNVSTSTPILVSNIVVELPLISDDSRPAPIVTAVSQAAPCGRAVTDDFLPRNDRPLLPRQASSDSLLSSSILSDFSQALADLRSFHATLDSRFEAAGRYLSS